MTPIVLTCATLLMSDGDSGRCVTDDGARCTITDTGRYRRNVAVCTVNGRDLGATLVREGLVISETNYGDPYRAAENEAREQGRGIWR